MPDLIIMILTTFLSYIMQYLFCFAVDKTDIERYQKKIKLNKYTRKLFFLWNRNEKLYWLVYFTIIIESILFIVVWIFYFLGDVNAFRKIFNIYLYAASLGDSMLTIKILIKRVKDYKSGKDR